jgi:phage baseplate assembly protein W
MANVDIIGTGWTFPIKVNANGGLSYTSGPDKIQQAIWIILSTALGERVMNPTFGAWVQDYVFQSNSTLTQSGLAGAVKAALVKWEPRIDIDSVTVATSPDQASQVLITINYRIRTTNELFNMVYPLYLTEGVV